MTVEQKTVTINTSLMPTWPIDTHPESKLSENNKKMERNAEFILLIVSHSLGTLEMVKRLLSLPNYRFLTATNGREGYEIAQRERPDMVISEALMPDLNGLEMCRLIRLHPDLCRTPILLISVGLCDSQIVEDVLEAGANDYLEAPFSPVHLRTKVAQLITHHQVEEKFRESEARYQNLFEDANNKAEALLKEREALYRTTFSNAPIGIAHTDLDGRWLQVNQHLCDILGYSREELLLKTFEKITYLEDVEADQLALEEYFAGEWQNCEREKRYIRKDGTLVWVHTAVSLLRGSAGEPKYVITAVQDISNQKRLEHQLLQSQKMEAIGHLTSGIVHGFNNLLTAITGYSELTIKRLTGDSTVKRNIEEIKKIAEHAALLTRQLLVFSRKQVLETKIFNLSKLISSMEILLQRLIGENIELWTLLERDISHIKADPGQIEQIVLNLVINARDAMPKGGKLIIETANVFLDRDSANQPIDPPTGHYVMLSVTDNGIGIDKQTQQRIFEPFFTTKEAGKGTGLGLSTVYGIVEKSGGNIWVASEVGQGTTFKVYLPCVDEALPVDPHQVEQENLIEGTETILLAEDDNIVRGLIRTILENYGYQVLEAANGDDALLIGNHHQGMIHLLLADVVMPSMSGQGLENHLRHRFPEMKALYVSGYTDEVIVHHGILSDDKPYLQKPFTPYALGRKVRELLDS